MNNPLAIEGTRICVLVQQDEVVICANAVGFKGKRPSEPYRQPVTLMI